MSLNYIEVSVTEEKKASYVLADKMCLTNFKILDSGKIRIYDSNVSPQQLAKALTLGGVEVTGIGKNAETLEDYFLKLTGR